MKRVIIYSILLIGFLNGQVDYNSQIQTIFNDNCTSCHINGGAYFGGLDLANYDSLMLGSNNGDVIIPGDHESSILWQKIDSGEMPPGNNDDLTSDQIDLIAQWIDEGALEQPTVNPVLTYLSIIPDTIDVSEGSIEVSFEMGADDYNSDLESGSLVLINPSNSQTVVGNIYFNDTSSDTSSTEVTILQYSENGTWEIFYISLYDAQGNVTTHYTTELGVLGYETELYVISSPVDNSEPVLTYFSLDPDTIDASQGFIGVNITLGAIDNLSGLSVGSVVFNSPSNSYTVVGNINYSGTLSDTLTIEINNEQYENLSEVGIWQVYYIDVYDIIGNVTTHYTSELDSLGFETEFLVNGGMQPCELGVVYVSEGHTLGDSENYIELYNSGDADCSLEGFQLDNSEDLEDFTFGAVTIDANGYWIGYEGNESSFTSSLSPEGDIIVFADPNNNILIVTLEEFQELDGLQLSQSFDAYGIGCYTEPTPGTANGDCITLTNDILQLVPEKVTLYQNYPNPFNPVTTLMYDLSEGLFVNITIYDMLGNIVNNLVNMNKSSGYKSVQWNGINNQGQPVSAGVYLYSIKAGDFRQTKKMILLK